MQAFVFPGQGSQCVGMGQSLAGHYATARQVFEEVNDALQYDLGTLMFEGPEADLTLTHNTQPALLTMSMAIMRVLEQDYGLAVQDLCQYVAGHSLGEYTALTAAKAITLTDAVRLVRLRGEAMQQAVPVGKGAMAAILGLDLLATDAIVASVQHLGECAVANDNCEGQVVISGTKEAVEAATVLAKEQGAKRALLLNVSAPFHCALMAPAAEAMAQALQDITINQPIVPVVANITAQAIDTTDAIRDLLVRQVTGRVRWRESVQWMHSKGVIACTEVGAGKVLAGLCQRSVAGMQVQSIQTPDDIENFIAQRKIAS